MKPSGELCRDGGEAIVSEFQAEVKFQALLAKQQNNVLGAQQVVDSDHGANIMKLRRDLIVLGPTSSDEVTAAAQSSPTPREN